VTKMNDHYSGNVPSRKIGQAGSDLLMPSYFALLCQLHCGYAVNISFIEPKLNLVSVLLGTIRLAAPIITPWRFCSAPERHWYCLGSIPMTVYSW